MVGFPGSRKMEFKGSCWHEACFVCQHCQQPLGTKPLITKDNDNYCVPCFEKQFAQHCYFCKKVRRQKGKYDTSEKGRGRVGYTLQRTQLHLERQWT